MGQEYSSLSIKEQTQLGLLAVQKLSQQQMAVQLGRSTSTVSRELARNRHPKRGYLADGTQQQASQRRMKAKAGERKLGQQLDTPLGKFVLHKLLRALSPEQVAGRLKLMNPDDPSQRLSHETIYQAVYLAHRGELRTEIIGHLRQGHAKRLPRARGTSRKKGNIANLVPLSERPIEADSRLVPGHWEGDFIKGKRNASAIGTAVERTSRYVLLTQMNGCTATHVLAGFQHRFYGVIPELRKSFTYDSGSEMAHHQELTATTGMPVFFSEPHSPWQRGSNENMNGLVRQFLPKDTDLSTVPPPRSSPTSKPCSMTGPARSSASEHPERSTPDSFKPSSPSGSSPKLLHFRLDTAKAPVCGGSS